MSYAAQQYQKQSGSYLNSREVEAMAFRYVNNLLENTKTHGDRISALSHNQKLWCTLLKNLDQNHIPDALKKDITKLGLWSLRQSNLALNSPVNLDPIIDINNDMIDGLSNTTA